MELIVIGAGIFLAAVVIIELLTYAFRHMQSARRVKIRKRLRRYAFVEGGADGTEILKKRIYSDVPALNSLLSSLPGIHSLDKLIIQANARQPVGFFILLSLTLAGVGFIATNLFTHNLPYAVLAAAIGLALPYLQLSNAKRKRIEKLKKQLPDTLDMIARSLKAGHAFTGGLSLAAEEMDDPIGPEFAETLDEINFGVSVSQALKNMTERIDCEELKFFVVGVILQRETGGNLAELMEILANLIRERFRFEGKVRTLTAEGKFSAIVLVILPFLLALYFWFTNPKFLAPLITTPIGRVMMLLAVVMMIVGGIVMRRMVDIKV
jgi:tight adherence protein B